MGPPPVQRIGPIAQTLAAELLGQLCSAGLSAELVEVCRPPAPSSVAELRARALSDVLALPQRAVNQAVVQGTAGFSDEQRLGVAFVASLEGSLEPAEVAHRLALTLGQATSPDCTLPAINGTDTLSVAVALFWEAAQHARTAGADQGAALEAALLGRLQSAGKNVDPLDPTLSARLARLKQSATQMQQYWAALGGQLNRQGLEALLRAELATLADALSISAAAELRIPNEVLLVVGAVLDADLNAALSTLQGWHSNSAALPQGALEAAATTARFLLASSRQEAERIVRGSVLGLGPWSEGVIVDGSAGVPQLDNDDFNIVGEATLGYQAKSFGITGHGFLTLYSLDAADLQSETIKAGGNIDAWYALSLSPGLELQFVGTFDGTVFDTSTLVIGDSVTLNEEDSLLIRGGGLLGIRYQRPYLGLGAWAGGEVQVENYDVITFDSDGQRAELAQQSGVGGTFQGRLRFLWAFVPDTLALRSAVDVRGFSLRRIASNSTTQAGDVTAVETDASAAQLELITNTFVDLEALRFFDFVPGAGVGVQYYRLSIAGNPVQTTTVPIYNLGIRRTMN